jgi:hypothetical protein
MDSLACPKCAKICTGKVGLAAHVRHCKAGSPFEDKEVPVAEVVAPAVAPQKTTAVSVIAQRGGYSVIGRFQTEADALLNLQGLQRFRR